MEQIEGSDLEVYPRSKSDSTGERQKRLYLRRLKGQ